MAETEVGDVRGHEGFYHYRQYNAVELAEKRTLEDVWHLLFEGAPARRRRAGRRFLEEIRPLRVVPDSVRAAAPGHRHRRASTSSPSTRCAPPCRSSAYAADFKPSLDIDAADAAGQRHAGRAP